MGGGDPGEMSCRSPRFPERDDTFPDGDPAAAAAHTGISVPVPFPESPSRVPPAGTLPFEVPTADPKLPTLVNGGPPPEKWFPEAAAAGIPGENFKKPQ